MASLFPLVGRIFNRKVKNDVENPLVTKVTMRKPAALYSLHWIGCEDEFPVKFFGSISR
jgi:hypothetical protein